MYFKISNSQKPLKDLVNSLIFKHQKGSNYNAFLSGFLESDIWNYLSHWPQTTNYESNGRCWDFNFLQHWGTFSYIAFAPFDGKLAIVFKFFISAAILATVWCKIQKAFTFLRARLQWKITALKSKLSHSIKDK